MFYWYKDGDSGQPVEIIDDRVYFIGSEVPDSRCRLKGTMLPLLSPDASQQAVAGTGK